MTTFAVIRAAGPGWHDGGIYDQPAVPVPIYVAAAGALVAKYAGRSADGFIWTKGECGIGTFQVEAEGIRLDFTDTNWIYYEFDWSNA